jgi:hypothetical protein
VADTLVIVPTKGRPQQFVRLVRAIWDTAAEPVDILALHSPGDFQNYREHLSAMQHDAKPLWPLRSVTVPAEFDSYSGKLARAATAMRKYVTSHRFLAVLNDDHEPVTSGWDRAFKDAIGNESFAVAYGPDGVWEDGQVPTAPFLTSSIVTALGWIALPGLQHILIDNVWMELAQGTDTLHFLRDVRIQHHHVDNGEAKWDATYRETQNNEPRNQQDRERWWAWQADGRESDIAKLRALA